MYRSHSGGGGPVPVAVIGTGSFGRHHARVYASLPEAELVAVVDKAEPRARQVAGEFGCTPLTAVEDLPSAVRAASVAVPTSLHGRIGTHLLRKGIDVLVEKPIAADLAAAEELVAAAKATGAILQVGHLERFNPAIRSAFSAATLPLFFEVHRLSPFSARSLDVDVVLDLMIHDIDIVRALARSEVVQVDASGLSVVSNRADIANARVQFRNGCVANLTASRVSTERIRKLRFFQPQEYISVDYAQRTAVRISLDEAKRPQARALAADDEEPLRHQLRAFLACVSRRERPEVDGREGLEALRLALRIRSAIDRHSRVVSRTLATGT